MSDFPEHAPPGPAPGVPPDAQSLVPIPPERIPAAVTKLDALIDGVMSKTGVPGLAAIGIPESVVNYFLDHV